MLMYDCKNSKKRNGLRLKLETYLKIKPKRNILKRNDNPKFIKQ